MQLLSSCQRKPLKNETYQILTEEKYYLSIYMAVTMQKKI